MKKQKKSILMQVMKPKDWFMLFFLILLAVLSWIWVLQLYSEPIGENLNLILSDKA